MDSEYLKSTVGPALTDALASMVVEQPSDAVEVSKYRGIHLAATHVL